MTFACEADAQQALATFTHGLQATFLSEGAVRARPRYGKRGRPSPGEQPAQVVYTLTGALASSSLLVRPSLTSRVASSWRPMNSTRPCCPQQHS